MHYLLVTLTAASALVPRVIAAPRPTPVEKRQASELSILNAVITQVADGLAEKVAFSEILSELEAITPTASPTDVPNAKSLLSAAYAIATPTGWIDGAALALENNLGPTNIVEVIDSLATGVNNPANVNTKTPNAKIYPKKNSKDAPYQQTEAEMRAQIYIPSTFTYGEKTPLLLVPGTGGRGGQNFGGNFIPLFTNVSYADPVWINPPAFQLTDAQLNSETVAYAINYISHISKSSKVNVVGWSQANINIHFASKYWLSVRNTISDHIAVSPE